MATKPKATTTETPSGLLIAHAHLVSVPGSPYSPSRRHDTPKKDKESHDDYEKRTWREKAHFDDKGMCFIPGMCFKKCISEAASFLGLKIGGGRGAATWTKHFLAGIQVFHPLPLNVSKDEVRGEWLYLDSDGKKNSQAGRVPRCFPCFDHWEGVVDFMLVDSTITRPIFERHLREAGRMIGIARWRPIKGGMNGMFNVTKVTYEEFTGENITG